MKILKKIISVSTAMLIMSACALTVHASGIQRYTSASLAVSFGSAWSKDLTFTINDSTGISVDCEGITGYSTTLGKKDYTNKFYSPEKTHYCHVMNSEGTSDATDDYSAGKATGKASVTHTGYNVNYYFVLN